MAPIDSPKEKEGTSLVPGLDATIDGSVLSDPTSASAVTLDRLDNNRESLYFIRCLCLRLLLASKLLLLLC